MSVTDITARRRAEEEQLKVQRLESLGVLAGGIAHDFNNLLTAILGNLSLLQAGGDEEQVLAETRKAVARARGLTEQLLTFSRGGAPGEEARRPGQASARYGLLRPGRLERAGGSSTSPPTCWRRSWTRGSSPR